MGQIGLLVGDVFCRVCPAYFVSEGNGLSLISLPNCNPFDLFNNFYGNLSKKYLNWELYLLLMKYYIYLILK